MLFPVAPLTFTSRILLSHWLIEISISHFYLYRSIRKHFKNFNFVLKNIEYLIFPKIYFLFSAVIYRYIFSIVIRTIDIQSLIALTSIKKIPQNHKPSLP